MVQGHDVQSKNKFSKTIAKFAHTMSTDPTHFQYWITPSIKKGTKDSNHGSFWLVISTAHLPHSQMLSNTRKAGSSRAHWSLVSAEVAHRGQ